MKNEKYNGAEKEEEIVEEVTGREGDQLTPS